LKFDKVIAKNNKGAIFFASQYFNNNLHRMLKNTCVFAVSNL